MSKAANDEIIEGRMYSPWVFSWRSIHRCSELFRRRTTPSAADPAAPSVFFFGGEGHPGLTPFPLGVKRRRKDHPWRR
jgi:hypothetical protein